MINFPNLNNRQLFFVFGLNKSGTTFLQSLINSHPKAVCPSEHHLTTIRKLMEEAVQHYRRLIEDFDCKTANQGVTHDDELAIQTLYLTWVEGLFSMAAATADESVSHVGINDNSLDQNLEFHAQWLPGSKYLFIVRDPRDVAVSLYYHRLRTELNFASSGISLGKTAAAIGRGWQAKVERVSRFNISHPGRVELVRYEDLIGERRNAVLSRVLGFLGLDTEKENPIPAMFVANDLAKLKKREKSKAKLEGTPEDYGFYRSGRKGGWKKELSAAEVAMLEKPARSAMKRLGYQVVTEE